MRDGYVREAAVSPFNASQRQRLEAFTAVRQISPNLTSMEAVRIADWITTGRKP